MKTRLFYDWVPENFDFWILLSLAIMLAFNGGIPSTIYSYVIGAEGADSADLSMASYSYVAGLSIVLPLASRLKQLTNSKRILGACFLLLIFLNFALSEAGGPLPMVMISFLIGIVKMLATLEVVLAMIPMLMPKGERYQLYCTYYPLSLIFSPISGWLAAWLAGKMNWEFSFHEQNLFLFAGLMLIVGFVHSEKNIRKVPLFQYDWFGSIALAGCLLLTSFCLCYGQMYDWFASTHIQAGVAGAALFLVLFFQRSFRIKRPLVDISVLSYWKALAGIFVLFMLCVFFNTTSLLNPFLVIILRNNPQESAMVNLYGLPGYLTGSAICFFYYRKNTRYNAMAALACACYLLSNAWMFFLISGATASSDLVGPLFFRSMGAIVTYISTGLYLTRNLPPRLVPHITFIIVGLRSFGAPIFASTLFSNWMYRAQVQHIDRIAGRIDALDFMARSRGSGIFTSIRTQASLLAMRDIYGFLSMAGIVFLVILIVFPFHGSTKRIVFDWSNPANAGELVQSVPL